MLNIFPSWQDIKNVFTFKAIYVILVMFLISIVILVYAVYGAGDAKPLLKTVLTAIGGSLLGTSVVSFSFQMLFAMDLAKIFRVQVENIMVGYQAKRFGMIGMGSRQDINSAEFMKAAKSELKLMGIGLPFTCDERGQNVIVERISDPNDDLRIKVLLLNPCSAAAYHRSCCIKYSTKKRFYNGLYYCIERHKEIGDRLNASRHLDLTRFDVRLYDSLPYCSLLIRDDVANVCFYLGNVLGASGIYYKIKHLEEEDYFSEFSTHFDKIWEESVSIFDPDAATKIEHKIQVLDTAYKTMSDFSRLKTALA